MRLNKLLTMFLLVFYTKTERKERLFCSSTRNESEIVLTHLFSICIISSYLRISEYKVRLRTKNFKISTI